MNIDLHAHIIPPSVMDFLRKRGSDYNVEVGERNGVTWIQHGEGYGYPAGPDFTDPDEIVRRTGQSGLDFRVLSIPPTFFYYNLNDERALEFARVANDGIAEAVRAHPQKLAGMATVPLHRVDEAVAELERAVKEHGFRAVEIGTNVESRGLDDPVFRPFFRACARLGVLVFLHPYYVGSKPGLESYYMTNSVGNPLETVLAVSRLTHGGVLDEIPDLKLLLAHGGGYYPYQRGRLDHCYRVRPEPKARGAKREPSGYISNFYFDTITHYAPALRFLVETVGAERVVVGTDYPFDMGVERPVEFVREAGLDAEAERRVLGVNAAQLLGLA